MKNDKRQVLDLGEKSSYNVHEGRKMKITVLEGSPNPHGSSNMLVDHFIRGAEEAGHTVRVIDAAHADIHPCTGCIHCGYEGPCVQKDDVETFRKDILEADMMVFVTPL